MKCVICHGEEVKEKQVREEVPMGNDIVYVEVKVLVCQSCGERYYDRRTVQFLEKVSKEINANQTNLKEIGKVLMYG